MAKAANKKKKDASSKYENVSVSVGMSAEMVEQCSRGLFYTCNGL